MKSLLSERELLRQVAELEKAGKRQAVLFRIEVVTTTEQRNGVPFSQKVAELITQQLHTR